MVLLVNSQHNAMELQSKNLSSDLMSLNSLDTNCKTHHVFTYRHKVKTDSCHQCKVFLGNSTYVVIKQQGNINFYTPETDCLSMTLMH